MYVTGAGRKQRYSSNPFTTDGYNKVGGITTLRLLYTRKDLVATIHEVS
jgi:hypothetical protein